MRRTAATLTAAIIAATLTLALAIPASAAVTVIQVLGRKAVTYTSYPFDPTPTAQWVASAQGESVDTNGNGIADSLRGRAAVLEDFGIIRARIYAVRTQALIAGVWTTVQANETDVISEATRAYAISYTPTTRYCGTDPTLTRTYRVLNSHGIRRVDGIVANRNLYSNTFTARALATDPDCPETSPPPPTPQADLSVSKTASVATVPGTTDTSYTYTIRVTNLGPNSATGVVVTDTLPADVDLAGLLPGNCTDTDPGAPVVVRCTIGALDPGEVGTVTLNVTADASDFTDDVIRNTAQATSSTADPNPANNTATATVLVRPLADLVMDKAADQTTVTVPGDTFRYILRVTNTGPSPAENVTTYDNLPAGVDLAAPLPAGCALDLATASLDDFTCNFGTLAPGATASYSIDVVTSAERADDTLPITNTATARTTTFEQDLADNADSATVTVNPSATS